LQHTLQSAPHLQLMLSRYAAILGLQVAQTAACNRLHEIGQRLAPLVADDSGPSRFRFASQSLTIFLATMLAQIGLL